MHIAFNINQLALIGLAATLNSLIQHCASSEHLHLYFLHHDLSLADKDNIENLLAGCKFRGKIEFLNFVLDQHFERLPALHGDRTIYGRLFIPELIKADQVLYLDSDLLVLTDVTDLSFPALDDFLLGAVKGSAVRHQIDQGFLVNRCEMQPDAPYFNSGVVLFNNRYWRQHSITFKWQQLVERLGKELVSHDQTLLNAIAKDACYALPSKLNLPWYPGKHFKVPEDGIIHFVGSPKPWDIMGSILTGGYDMWRSYTPEFWVAAYGGMNWQKIVRTWRIRRSIGRTMKAML